MNTIEMRLNHTPCNYTIALIDSDQVLNNTIADALRAIGCTILQAFSSDEIPSIITQNPDFIVMDPIFETCDEQMLREYLSQADSAGIVIFSSDISSQRREYLFESGILEYISKDEPLEEVADELISLFETLQSNASYHVTMIGGSETSQQQFKQLVRHRGYQLCFLMQCNELMEKWNDQSHELPDLLVLDLTTHENAKGALKLIHFIRVHKLSEIPIILLINESESNLSSKLYRAGTSSILVKPYSYEKLLSKITHHLDYQINKKWLKSEQSLSAQLKTMIDSSSIVSKTDPRGVITYVNDHFCQITGYSREELIGKPHNIIRHPDNSPMLFEQMWKTIQNQQIFHGMLKNRRKDGSNYYVDTTISPIIDDNNTIIEYISIRHDVTPLIEKQHEIEEQRHRIQNVLDAQTSLICMVDKSKGVIQSNRGFMEFLGITSLDPKVTGFKNLSELFLDVDDAFQVHNADRVVCLDRLYELRGKFVKVAMKDRFYNHHIFAIHVEKIPDNRFTDNICYLVTLENITQLNRALREAKASSEAESRFLATMSHEIRTPLNGILGFAELLGETPLNEQQQKYLQTIEYSGETLRQIINDILDVMKFDREQLELNIESANIIGELEAMIYPFYSIAAKKGVDLLVFIDPQLPSSVDVDLLRLKQILINLISNAIKFTPSGKRVYVHIKKLKMTNNTVTIGFTVADEGIGVKPEHKENIFKPFIQADNSIAREFGGTGLGLNIVTRVIAAMDGKIVFKSRFGSGSVFHTTLDFVFNSTTSHYKCQKHITYLYLPASKPTPRFLLVERYLKGFACCDSHLLRVETLHNVEDNPQLHIILFMDMMSVEQIAAISKQFTHAKLFVVPSALSCVLPLSLTRENLIYLPEELSWSTISKRLEIDDQQKPIKPKEVQLVTFEGLNLLVAEDNEVNQIYIHELLKTLKVDHALAHDGYEAVKKCINTKYDLILMDINMPNMDGITATQQILQYENETLCAHTPIIGLSADAIAKNIAQYMKQGLDGYLVKPLRKQELITLLTKYFTPHVHPHNNSSKPKMEPIMQSNNEGKKSLAAFVASKIELPHEIVMELFKKFINNAETILTQIQEQHNNEITLKMAIHSLKGISKNLYLEGLGNACEEFEKEVLSLTPDQKHSRLKAIEEETTKHIQQMKEELA